MKKANKFNYPVTLIPLNIPNKPKVIIMIEILNKIPYLLYGVEALEHGRKVVINKPWGKRSSDKLSKNDFKVFILTIQRRALTHCA